MSTFEFTAEVAPSGRAKCKSCKSALPKSEIRFGVRQLLDPTKGADMDDRQRAMIEAVHWYHPVKDCFGTFRKTAKWWIENCPAPSDVKGFGGLEESVQSSISDMLKDLSEGKMSGSGKKEVKYQSEAVIGSGRNKPATQQAQTKAKTSAAGKKRKTPKDELSESDGGRGSSSDGSSEFSSGEGSDSSGDESPASDGRKGSEKKKSKTSNDDKEAKRRKKEKTSPEESDNESASSTGESATGSSAAESEESNSSSRSNDKRKVENTLKSSKQMSEKTKRNDKKKDGGNPTEQSGLMEYKAESLASNQVDKIRDACGKLSKKNLTQLKEMLRINKQLCTGRKEELIVRVAEGQILGGLPKCNECESGTLKWDCHTGRYSCPGYFNEDVFKRCGWKGEAADVERVPWKSF